MIDIVSEDDEPKSMQRSTKSIRETVEAQGINKGAFLSSLSMFKPDLLSVVTGTIGVRAVYNSDTRLFIASDEYRGRIDVRDSNGNFQVKVKIGDLVDRVRSALAQKLGKEVGFYSKNQAPTHLYCFLNTRDGPDGEKRLSVLQDGIAGEIKLSQLKDCYYKMTVVLRSGLIKIDNFGNKYTWSLNAYGIKLITPTRDEIDKYRETELHSYSHGIDFCKAL